MSHKALSLFNGHTNTAHRARCGACGVLPSSGGTTMYTTSGMDMMHMNQGTDAAKAHAPQLIGARPGRESSDSEVL